MADVAGLLSEIVGDRNVETGSAIADDYAHDEALTATAQLPAYLARPRSTDEVAAIVTLAGEHGLPVTARGSGTGLCGGAVPAADAILISFERMNRIVEIDLENHMAVIEPGVTLQELDEALLPLGLVYPVFPGEYSASLGGNVATNAGGMRAVKYGVTRSQVLALVAVLGTGEVIRTGGKFMKATSGYDLTQLIIGSEGTLAIVTEATVRLYPRPEHVATVLAPYRSLKAITDAIPAIVWSGVGPVILEYIDFLSMGGILSSAGLELGVPNAVKETALAYLVVVLEEQSESRLEENLAKLAELLGAFNALDVYVLPAQAGAQLIEARERAFFVAKAAGADDIIDMVMPRNQMTTYLETVGDLARASGSFVTGCGHAGDGNVHISVFQSDPATRHAFIHDVFVAGMALGGAISGEHGIGTEKRSYFLEFEDPAKLALMRRIKSAFDPAGILNPGKLLD
jgi:glycolate oxidase